MLITIIYHLNFLNPLKIHSSTYTSTMTFIYINMIAKSVLVCDFTVCLSGVILLAAFIIPTLFFEKAKGIL